MPKDTLSLFLKQKNIAEVLKVLHLEQAVSRAKIAALTGVAPSTVSSIVDKLEKEQIVEYIEGSLAPSSIGRPPLLLRYNPTSFYVLGIEINLLGSQVMIVGIDGAVVLKREIIIKARDNPGNVLSHLADMAAQVIAESEIEQNRIIGIGVSFRGLIDRHSGRVQRSTSLPEWENINIVEGFKARFGLPVYAENNANAMVLGETRFGAGCGKKNVLGVIIEEGIGGGIIINGRLYLGMHSAAGELGHMSVASSGPICHCGNRGCLRTLASESAIETNAIRIMKTGVKTLLKSHPETERPAITAQDVVDASSRGDQVSREIILEAAGYLGTALVNLTNLLSPELIIFNYGTLTSYQPFTRRVTELISERSYSKEIGTPETAISLLGLDAVGVGAASVVMDRLLAAN
ncbi:MAG: ROK family transcriptional regulator [Spirochaetaceae bacterium]|nr:MAG: ROK family transcriptional regulator [Spirochaetaceae bacterium]